MRVYIFNCFLSVRVNGLNKVYVLYSHLNMCGSAKQLTFAQNKSLGRNQQIMVMKVCVRMLIEI